MSPASPDRTRDTPPDNHVPDDDHRSMTVTRHGSRLAVSRDVAVAPAVAAELLRDTRAWTAWDPTIDGVESEDRYVREGSRGRIRVGGVWLPFHVTDFNGRRWRKWVVGMPTAAYRVERYAGTLDRCRVIIEIPVLATRFVSVCEQALDRFAHVAERRSGDGSTVNETQRTDPTGT